MGAHITALPAQRQPLFEPLGCECLKTQQALMLCSRSLDRRFGGCTITPIIFCFNPAIVGVVA